MTQILLATYNGEKYLPELFASLLAQTDQDWTLLVRDDNSTDRTPQIIAEFEKSHPGKVQVVRDHGTEPNDNLGPKDNFSRLLTLSHDPYVMFCDQDDIWKSDKIERTLNKMHELEAEYGKGTPLLVHSDLSLCDAGGKEITKSSNDYFKEKKEKTSLSRLMLETPIAGLTVMMNRSLADKAGSIPPVAGMHDAWVGQVAALTGRIGYINESLVARRVHENNVTGVGKMLTHKGPWERVTSIYQDGIPAIWSEKLGHYRKESLESAEIAGELIRRYGEEAGEDKKKILQASAELPTQGWGKQARMKFKHDLSPTNPRYKLESYLFARPQETKDEKSVVSTEGQQHHAR